MVIIAYCILVVAWCVIPSSGFVGELSNTLLEYVVTDIGFGDLYEVCLLMYEALRNYLQCRGK